MFVESKILGGGGSLTIMILHVAEKKQLFFCEKHEPGPKNHSPWSSEPSITGSATANYMTYLPTISTN